MKQTLFKWTAILVSPALTFLQFMPNYFTDSDKVVEEKLGSDADSLAPCIEMLWMSTV